MPFPYEHYETLAEPLTVYYPTGQDTMARWIFQSIEKAGQLLTRLLGRPMPEMEIMLVAPDDWSVTPHEDSEEPNNALPYWTNATQPPSVVVPLQLDPIIGTPTQEKLAFLLHAVLTQAFLENDPRPWPSESPLWADEWQLQFAALWLMQQIHRQAGIVMKDLHERYAEYFEPELDGKTPVTVRGFDWYEDTSSEEYLFFSLLLEQFAADLLANYRPEILPRFLDLYRNEFGVLLSDDVTDMLASVLGPDGAEWLEELVYF
jgi:hypothetical protein